MIFIIKILKKLEMSRQSVSFAGLVALSCFVFWGCEGGRPDHSKKNNDSSNSFVYVLGNDITSFDPTRVSDMESFQVAIQIYEGLVRFKKDSTEVEPCLAESYSVSEDGLTWNFKLRENVKFHDGNPLTSSDVKFSIMRQIDETHPHHLKGMMKYSKLLFGDKSTTETALVDTVETPDSHTVVIKLVRPYTPFLKNLALPAAAVMNEKAVSTQGLDANTTASGTGPFQLAAYERDQRITIVKNPHYWEEPAQTDSVVFRVLRDPNTRLNSIRRGKSDITGGIDPNSLQLIENNPDIAVVSKPSLNTGYLALNNKRKPFDDPRVRLAMNYAIDREFIVEKLFNNTSVEAKTIIPPGMVGHNSSLEGFPYNPEKAKQLLAEAGYPQGFKVKFAAHDRPRIYNPVGIRLAERIQRDLARVGIEAEIDQMEFPTFLSRQKARDYQMSMSGWISDNGDPDNFIYELAGRGDNDSNYSNPPMTELMRKASSEPDESKRAEMYKAIEAEIAKNPPFIYLNNAKQIMAVRKRVKNFIMHPTGTNFLKNISVED